MSKRSVTRKVAQGHFIHWYLIFIFGWLFHPTDVASQPASQPSVKIELAGYAEFGGTIEVSIDWINDDSTFEVGGFDLLMRFDQSALTLLSAEPGQLQSDCAWEYFAYRVGSLDTCGGSPCPSDVIRLVAVADINNGTIYPTCFGDSSGELARLKFQVTTDTSYNCQFLPIRFTWYDCGDNTFASKGGDTLFVSRDVYDYVGYYQQINQDDTFPTFLGVPDNCVDTLSVLRMIDYYNGGVEIICIDSMDERGDINLNGIAYEIADWMMFINYLLFGDTAFTVDPDRQMEATDANADGIVATLDDLVYLWRVIIGDAQPYPRPQVPPFDTAVFIQDDTSRTVSLTYPDSLTAYYLVFRGNIVPTSLIAEPSLGYHFDGTHTRVLGHDMSMTLPLFAPGPLLSYTGNGILEEAYTSLDGLIKIETSISLNGYPGSHAEISPDTISAYVAYVPDTTAATVYFGDFADQVATGIDQSTIHINDTMVAISTQVLPSWPGFTGEVMEVTFSAGEFVQGYLPLYDTTAHNYMITGEFVDTTPFTVFGGVTMSGLLLGDVDFDGEVNIADLTFLVDYLFREGTAPPVMATADLNFDGAVNIADVTSLVQLLFG